MLKFLHGFSSFSAFKQQTDENTKKRRKNASNLSSFLFLEVSLIESLLWKTRSRSSHWRIPSQQWWKYWKNKKTVEISWIQFVLYSCVWKTRRHPATFAYSRYRGPPIFPFYLGFTLEILLFTKETSQFISAELNALLQILANM